MMTATHPNLDVLLSRLHSVTAERDGNWLACCPAHGDRNPSLIVGVGASGNIILHCRSRQCSTEAIVQALGMAMKDLMPPRDTPAPAEAPAELSWEDRIECAYDYYDEAGQVLFQVVRLHSPKDFKQRRPSGGRLNERNQVETVWTWKVKGVRQVPYRLPQIMAAPADQWLLVVEGEKDADALARLGVAATTNPGGAGKWGRLDDAAVNLAFGGRRIAVLPDNDNAGLRHAIEVAESLASIAGEVRIVELPGLGLKGDVSDWLKQEGVRA